MALKACIGSIINSKHCGQSVAREVVRVEIGLAGTIGNGGPGGPGKKGGQLVQARIPHLLPDRLPQPAPSAS